MISKDTSAERQDVAAVKSVSPSKVADNLRRQCSKREYCVSDVQAKAIRMLGGDRNRADEIVAALVEEKYVDDRRYAHSYVRDKSSLGGWGVTKIRYMLSLKGIPRDVIDEAILEIDSSKAASKLERLMECKCRSLLGDPQCKLKLLRYGLGRGYSYEQLEPLVSRLIKETRGTI